MRRHKHNLSHYKVLSCNQGEIVPLSVVEVLPGDSIRSSSSAFVRVAPLQHPVMHPVKQDVMQFFVPYRILDPNFEDFITGGDDGDNAYTLPTITAPAVTGFQPSSLADYLGCETGVPNLAVQSYAFMAYNMIFNEWFRDKDLMPEVALNSTALQNACWGRDYFNGARPWEQKGPAVSIPLNGTAPVMGTGKTMGFTNGGGRTFGLSHGDATARTTMAVNDYDKAVANTGGISGAIPAAGSLLGLTLDGAKSGVVADLSSIPAIDINDLKAASAIQRFQENRALYGSDYVEYLRFLGIRSSDGRLQRPELISRASQTIQFSEVLQTAEGVDPVGTMKGHGIGYAKGRRATRFYEEHGVLITLSVVRPLPVYMSGVHRMFLRKTKEDFWHPEFEHIGQQEVMTQEIYGAAPAGEVFAYTPRYNDYRHIPNKIHGEMRTLLKDWHMAREFGAKPVLNADFVRAVPTDRVYAVGGQDHLYMVVRNTIVARRFLSKAQVSRLM